MAHKRSPAGGLTSRTTERWAWSATRPDGAVDEPRWVGGRGRPVRRTAPVKHTALGQFMHENASVRFGPTGRVVVYMGDDAADQFLLGLSRRRNFDPRLRGPRTRSCSPKARCTRRTSRTGKWLTLDVPCDFVVEGVQKQSRRDDANPAGGQDPRGDPRGPDRGHRDSSGPGSLYVAMTGNPGHGNFTVNSSGWSRTGTATRKARGSVRKSS